MRRVYLDNNATTPVLPEVFEAMRPFYLEQFGNASSIHHYGQHGRAALEKAQEWVAALGKARRPEIVLPAAALRPTTWASLGWCSAAITLSLPPLSTARS